MAKSRRIARGPNGAFIHQVEGMRWLPVRWRAGAAADSPLGSGASKADAPLTPEERDEEET